MKSLGRCELIFLGTNGWYDSATGSTICTMLRTPQAVIFLDAGFGLAKAVRLIDPDKPAFIFLSHMHLDHSVGLHALAMLPFRAGVTLVAPPALVHDVKRFLSQPLTMPIKRIPFGVTIKAAPLRLRIPGGAVVSRELVHTSPCYGYRFEFKNATVAYCTDTGPCDNAALLGRGADVLITECALRSGQQDDGWPHLNPEAAARLAQQAGARKLVLTHFDAYNYQTLAQRRSARMSARRIFPNVVAAVDGLKITF